MGRSREWDVWIIGRDNRVNDYLNNRLTQDVRRCPVGPTPELSFIPVASGMTSLHDREWGGLERGIGRIIEKLLSWITPRMLNVDPAGPMLGLLG
jgi:hypothetical protein